MNSAFDINMEVFSNGRLKKELQALDFATASEDLNCFVTKCGDYALAKKNFPYDDIENPAQSVIDTCKECIKSNPQKNDFIVIYGLGLGYILDEVYTSYPSRIFVYEPDINVIRFVMENVDFTHILADKRVFITNDCNECCKKIGEQYLSHDKLEIVFLKNYGLIKPQELIKLTNTLFNTCKARISDIKTIEHISKAWTKNIIKNIENDTYIKPFYNFDNSVAGKTALVLSAGPSLLDNIENIKNNRNKFSIFAIGDTLKTLFNNEITPDFTVFAEAFCNSSTIETLPEEYLSQIYCISEIKADSKIPALKWKDKFFYFANNSDFIAKFADKYNIKQYPAIGTPTLNALMCASQMGFKKIAICGFDLAFKENIAYCDNTTFSINENKIIIGDKTFNKTIVPSVNGEMVTTREDFATFIPQCENSLKLISEDVELYNITDFGANIKGLKYTSFENIIPSEPAADLSNIISTRCTDKLNLRNSLESEIDRLEELKELFSTNEINYSKIYALKKSPLLSEYIRYDILELVQSDFAISQIEIFVKNILKAIEEVKELILEKLVLI